MSTSPDCEPIVDSSLGQELEKDECQVLSSVMKIKDLKDGENLVKEGDEDFQTDERGAGVEEAGCAEAD